VERKEVKPLFLILSLSLNKGGGIKGEGSLIKNFKRK